MSELIPLMPLTALAEGDMTACRVGADEVLVANVHGQCFAVGNRCPHAGEALARGTLDGFELRCPRHGATFDIRTGAATNGAGLPNLARYNVVLEGGRINLIL